MKKTIIQNDTEYYIKYTTHRKKKTIYSYNKVSNFKSLEFLKNEIQHRPCNLGPQFRNKNFSFYKENDRSHNLYGPAYMSKKHNSKQYWIYGNYYDEDKFYNYLSIYNNLFYKRIY